MSDLDKWKAMLLKFRELQEAKSKAYYEEEDFVQKCCKELQFKRDDRFEVELRIKARVADALLVVDSERK